MKATAVSMRPAGKAVIQNFCAAVSGKPAGSTDLTFREKRWSRRGYRLERAGCADQAVLICDGHEKMADYVKDQAAVIMFNFGYLPGGDHSVATRQPERA